MRLQFSLVNNKVQTKIVLNKFNTIIAKTNTNVNKYINEFSKYLKY